MPSVSDQTFDSRPVARPLQDGRSAPVADDDLSRILAALADPTRRAILSRLAHGEASVTELAAPFEITMPAVSRHLRVLEQAGLVRRRHDAQRRPRRLDIDALWTAAAWLRELIEAADGAESPTERTPRPLDPAPDVAP
ncbi:ArsR/SmtB family transcription factor [Micromonospora sp. 15K316]|uniref:ArsR/SmtB family transcription factor n=1 Tax=Micromonospora sp. 15K316 TaxID=2530376 RepID=UPI00352C5195